MRELKIPALCVSGSIMLASLAFSPASRAQDVPETKPAAAPADGADANATKNASEDLYAAPAAADVRSKAIEWVAGQGVTDKAVLQAVGEIWAIGEERIPARRLLTKTVQTFALVDEPTRDFLGECNLAEVQLLPPDAGLLDREGLDPFYMNNLRLFYARYLSQRQMYDEAVAQFGQIDPHKVVDPATYFFFKAVCEHQLLLKTEGLASINTLLKNTEEVPGSYTQVATLMQFELQNLREGTLDEISGLMRDVGRQLNHARAGRRVQKREDEIVAKLDELIEKLEQQSGGGGGSGDGAGKGQNQSSSPAGDSRIMGQTAPGNVDKKNFAQQAGWGALPAKQEAKAKQMIARQFPPHYRQAVEEYFKKQAAKRRPDSRP